MKIAIIGSGISGLSASYLLNQQHDITLIEKNNYLGGHARTYDVPFNGKNIAIDTGFLVYNERNYPNLTKLFGHLDVATEKSNMSFGVSIEEANLEYGTRGLHNLFAQRKNLFRPQFYLFIYSILRFNKKAQQFLALNSDITLGDFIKNSKFSHWLKQYYLLPMGGAIWSTSIDKMLDFPAKQFLQFFNNHGLLTLKNRPKWRTVSGGSRNYVEKIIETFKDKIIYNTKVTCISHSDEKLIIEADNGYREKFDQVVIATHSDEVLPLLHEPTAEETEIFNKMPYHKNTIYLHTDISFMPKTRKCWSSWVYLSEKNASKHNISLTYWLNSLQNITEDIYLFVTLNPSRKPAKESIINVHEFEHPYYNFGMFDAQNSLHSIQGKRNIWYCGAYQGHGFHEDGLKSAMHVAKSLGAKIPWQ